MKTVEIGEDAGIKTVKKYYGIIKTALDEDSEVVLDLGGVKRLDLAMVQLVAEAGREARKRNALLKLKSVPAGVKTQLAICGIGS